MSALRDVVVIGPGPAGHPAVLDAAAGLDAARCHAALGDTALFAGPPVR
ncbi:hypothetical protein ACFVWY_01340 [Streptomyces sp. NPDC058195]